MFNGTKLTGLALATACAMAISSAASAAIVYQAEFNTSGDKQGWTGNTNITVAGTTADGDSLNGTASTGDPRLAIAGLSVSLTPPNTGWDQLIFRVREFEPTAPAGYVTSFDATGVVFLVNNVAVTGATFVGTSSGDDFITVTADISGLSAGTTINSMRLDPIGGTDAAGNTFELDYIRVTAVPEPASLGLLGLGGLIAGRRRGR